MLAERFLDDRRLLPALRFDLDLAPFLPLEAERRRDRERPPFDELRFLEQPLFREALRFLDLLRFRDPARFPEQLRFRERLRDLRPLDAERFLLPVK